MQTKRLIKRAQTGDTDAFAELFQSRAQKLWACAMQILHNEADAADALQEAAIKSWKAIPNFDGKSDIATWMTRILINGCYDILRKQNREAALPLDEIIELTDMRKSDTNNHSKIVITDVLDKLTPDDKQILTLFYYADLSMRTIAEMLGINETTARVRLTRARVRFRTLYLAE